MADQLPPPTFLTHKCTHAYSYPPPPPIKTALQPAWWIDFNIISLNVQQIEVNGFIQMLKIK